MAVSVNWGSPFRGRPDNKSPTFGVTVGPLFFESFRKGLKGLWSMDISGCCRYAEGLLFWLGAGSNVLLGK